MAAENEIEFLINAKDGFSRVFSDAAGALGGLGKAAGALVGAFTAVAGSMLLVAKRSASVQDEMRRTALQTNENIRELSELAHFAELTDVGFEGLATSLSFAQRAMGEAVSGNAQMVQAFDDAGVAFRDQNGNLKAGSELLADFADRLASGANQQEIMAAGTRIFGRQFKEMLPALLEGSDAMRKAAEDARFLGVSMNDQAAANADAFGDEMTRLGQAIKGVTVAVGNEWIPIMTGMIRAAANWIAEMRGTFVEWAKIALDGMLRVYATAEAVIVGLINGFKKLFSADGFDEWLVAIGRVFAIAFDTGIHFIANLGPAIIDGFVVVWEGFIELAKWALDNVFDLFTGQDLAGTIGQALFERIPQATEKYRKQFSESGRVLIEGVAQGAREAGVAVGELLGIDSGAIDARIEELRQRFTTFGDVVKRAGKVAGEGAARALEEAYIKIGIVGAQFTESRIAQIERERKAFEQLGVDKVSLDAWEKQQLLEHDLLLDEQRKALMQQQYDYTLLHTQSLVEVWAVTMELLSMQAQTWAEITGQLIQSTFNSVVQGVGNAVAQAIVYGASFADAMRALIKQVIASLISELITWAIKSAFFKMKDAFSTIAAEEAKVTANAAGLYAQAFSAYYPYASNVYTAAAESAAYAAGVVGVMQGSAQGLLASAAGAATAVSGAAHGGMGYVPAETTYLLDRGERVLSPNQNADLTAFLEGQGSGGGPSQMNIVVHVLENATNAEALLQMRDADIREIVARKILPAFDVLDRRGVRPTFVERYNR